MAWLPFLQSESIKPEWENRYVQLISAKNFSSTESLGVEKETSGDEINEEEIDEEPQKRYDPFELDD